MWCLRCGEKEPGNLEKCRQCEYPIGPPDNRSYLQQLMKLAGDLLVGNIEKEVFEGALSNFSKMLDEMYRGYLDIEKKMGEEGTSEDSRYLMSRPLNSFREAIDIFSSAIEALRMYLVDPDEEHLKKGFQLIEKGNNAMNYCSDVSYFAMNEIERLVPSEALSSGE